MNIFILAIKKVQKEWFSKELRVYWNTCLSCLFIKHWYDISLNVAFKPCVVLNYVFWKYKRKICCVCDFLVDEGLLDLRSLVQYLNILLYLVWQNSIIKIECWLNISYFMRVLCGIRYVFTFTPLIHTVYAINTSLH